MSFKSKRIPIVLSAGLLGVSIYFFGIVGTVVVCLAFFFIGLGISMNIGIVLLLALALRALYYCFKDTKLEDDPHRTEAYYIALIVVVIVVATLSQMVEVKSPGNYTSRYLVEHVLPLDIDKEEGE